MNREQLIKEIFDKKSFLCVGLDTDLNKIPKHLLDDDDPISFSIKLLLMRPPHTVFPTNLILHSMNAMA